MLVLAASDVSQHLCLDTLLVGPLLEFLNLHLRHGQRDDAFPPSPPSPQSLLNGSTSHSSSPLRVSVAPRKGHVKSLSASPVPKYGSCSTVGATTAVQTRALAPRRSLTRSCSRQTPRKSATHKTKYQPRIFPSPSRKEQRKCDVSGIQPLDHQLPLPLAHQRLASAVVDCNFLPLDLSMRCILHLVPRTKPP